MYVYSQSLSSHVPLPLSLLSYGIGYGAWKQRLGCQVSTYHGVDGAGFIANVKKVLDNIKQVMDGNNFKK